MGNICSIKRTKEESPKKRNFKEKCNSAVETLRKSLKIKSKKSSHEHLSAIMENKETEENTNENENQIKEESKDIKEVVVTTEENAVKSDENTDTDIIVHTQMSRDSSIITAVFVEDKLIEFGEDEKEETVLIKEYLNNYRERENSMEEPRTEIDSDSFVNDLLEIHPDNFIEISTEKAVSNEIETKTEDICNETEVTISDKENVSANEENTKCTEIIEENQYANEEEKNPNLSENEQNKVEDKE